MKQSVAAAVLVLLVAAFAAFVFPTRYQYLPGSNARPRVLAVRVDRLTGAAYTLSDTGWRSLRPAPPENPFGFVPVESLLTGTD